MNRTLISVLALTAFGVGRELPAQQPTVQQALGLKPMQRDVEFDRPEGEEVEKCKIRPEEQNGHTAWVVRGPAGELLRRFVDTNGDNKVDQWCYYRNGIEVYRDLDADFNSKADQYRWLGTAGLRHGLDKNEDGRIDAWQAISAEELTSEAVAALRDRDAARFQNLLLTQAELDDLGLSREMSDALSARLKQAGASFSKLASQQKVILADTEWVDFGALRPGLIPAGTNGAKRDLVVYENVVAMVETSGKPGQIQIGTMIQVGANWRLIDVPGNLGETAEDSGPRFTFFEAAQQATVDTGEAGEGVSPEVQRLVSSLEELDKKLAGTSDPKQVAELNATRADTLEKLAENAAGENDRDMWLMQFADTVGAAAQSGAYPEGTQRLESLLSETRRDLEERRVVVAPQVRPHDERIRQ